MNATRAVNDIVIVGGGSAGWLTACLLAATHSARADQPLQITVVESEKTPPIGVGEGTWPTMRKTLARIGIDEPTLFNKASATFKQASKFVNWHDASSPNAYYHPFSAPQGSGHIDLTPYWLAGSKQQSYAHSVSFQPSLCDDNLAPRAAFENNGPIANYGYHFDASAFVALLKSHGTEKLGVKLVTNDVVQTAVANDGTIDHIQLKSGEMLSGDLFVDCTGFSCLLLGQALGVGMKDKSSVLFADTALTCQVKHDQTLPVKPYTQSTAQSAGWIWDIGLPERRGVGYVYSSRHCTDDEAASGLSAYLNGQPPIGDLRTIRFKTGYRQQFWQGNCVAIGLSAGFLEPLEASALMLIELSATMLAEQLPGNYGLMRYVASRFNAKMKDNWEEAIQFLKLHYLLSQRDEPFWVENKTTRSVPDWLRERLEEWQYRPPLDSDFTSGNPLFSAQSYRYVLYGMQAISPNNALIRTLTQPEEAQRQFMLNSKLTGQMQQHMPPHAAFLQSLPSTD